MAIPESKIRSACTPATGLAPLFRVTAIATLAPGPAVAEPTLSETVGRGVPVGARVRVPVDVGIGVRVGVGGMAVGVGVTVHVGMGVAPGGVMTITALSAPVRGRPFPNGSLAKARETVKGYLPG